jgi:hypothetical protein
VQNLTVDLTGGTDKATASVRLNHSFLSATADRAHWNAKTRPWPDAGRYTMILPGNPDDPARPDGDGFATLSVSTRGVVKAAGMLADNTRLTVSGPISKNGQWPLFVRIQRGAGILFGWIQFPDNGQTNLTWIKVGTIGEKFYTNGFHTRFDSRIVPYSPPPAGATIPVVLDGGGFFEESATSFAAVTDRGQLVPVADDRRMKISLKPATGLFRGSFAHPQTGSAVTFNGAYADPAQGGAGFFINPPVSGRVRLE